MGRRILPRIQEHDRAMALEPWDGEGRRRARGWKLLTLTSPVARDWSLERAWSASELRRRILHVRRAGARFWRLTSWGRQVARARADGPVVKRSRRDTSALFSLEVGTERAMVHLHVLVYGEFLPQKELAATWSKALGVAAFVDVQAVDDPANGIREVLKYVAKGSAEQLPDPAHAAAIELALREVHRVSVLGALRRFRGESAAAEHDDLTAADVHDTKVAACEDCGCIGEWQWRGVISAKTVEGNGGFGRVRDLRWPIEILDLGLTDDQLETFGFVSQAPQRPVEERQLRRAHLGESA